MFTIRREDLEKCGACNFDAFNTKAGGNDKNAIVYPNGWQAADTTRVATNNPRELLFLALKGLIPVSYVDAVIAVQAAHGKKAHEIVSDFRNARPQ
jgi:hypothetical protein